MGPPSPPSTLHAILNLAPQAKMKEIEDGHRREAIITHPDRNRENVVVEAAARFAQSQNANETPKNPEEEHAVEGNRENVVVDAAARFAQSQNANETPKNPEEEDAVEGKEDNPDFCESISREFSGGGKQEREDEEDMMECLKKTNDGLDEIATACEKVGQSLERFEKTTSSFGQRIERMHWKSAAADATADTDAAGDATATVDADADATVDAHVDVTAPADATATAAGSSSGSGSGGGNTPLASVNASVNNSRAEQGDSPKRLWSEEVVESDSIWNEVGGGEREGAFNKRDLSTDEQYRTVRESAPSPEPRPGLFRLGL